MLTIRERTPKFNEHVISFSGPVGRGGSSSDGKIGGFPTFTVACQSVLDHNINPQIAPDAEPLVCEYVIYTNGFINPNLDDTALLHM